ncbi:MAG: M24 family metallopeptidase C-terminal domain-containing protein, partial [Lachnospiraceae bacterium]|nr:M24 family metallopeptidase C-terminal domain-containing protein [Lachnospiraceae bacterium]
TKFIYGCSGEILDIMAREPMWKEGLDYKCGTGHGIGHVLNVHEGPHNIRWRIGPDGPTAVLETGMVVSNEPGVYKEGLYGIRTENEMFVKPYMSTPDGQFMQFENMTFIPIDLDGIDKKYLSQDDVKMLNEYHRQVFETVSPLLDEEVKAWLKEYTREI